MIMPAFYLPVIVMLLALVFRGVAFEFRWVAVDQQALLEFRLRRGLGARRIVPGRDPRRPDPGSSTSRTARSRAARSTGRRRSPCCADSASIAGYALLGATWLVMKTDGAVAKRNRAHAKVLLIVVLGFMAAVSLWTPLAVPRIAERWFSLPNFSISGRCRSSRRSPPSRLGAGWKAAATFRRSWLRSRCSCSAISGW